MELNACIGIISYLPDDIRVERRERLESLLGQLNRLFKKPIIIIAQNWVEDDFKIFEGLTNQKIYVYIYPKLGITGARITLRQKFLESDYDWLIMLDDDMAMKENPVVVQRWLDEIKDKEFYFTSNFLANFCAISKEGMKKVFYDSEVDSSKGTGFEDWIFANRCTYNLRSEPFKTFLPIAERREFLEDGLSTWDPHDPALKKRNEDVSREKIYNIRTGKENAEIKHRNTGI